LKLEELKSRISKLLTGFGLKSNYLSEHDYLLYPVVLTCSDAFTDEIEFTAKHVVKEMKENANIPRSLDTETKQKHWEALLKTASFRNLIQMNVENISSPQAATRLEALQALNLIGANDSDSLLAVARQIDPKIETDEEVRKQARELIQARRPKDSATCNYIIDFLDQSDSNTQSELAYLMQSIQPTDPKDLQLIIERLIKGTQNQNLQYYSAIMLGNLGISDITTLKSLVSLHWNSTDPYVSALAAIILIGINKNLLSEIGIQESDIRATLLSYLEGPVKDLRRIIIHGLADLGDGPNDISILLALLRHPGVKNERLDAISGRRAQFAENLAKRATPANYSTPADPKVVSQLLEALLDTYQPYGTEVAEALVKTGTQDAKVIRALLDALDNQKILDKMKLNWNVAIVLGGLMKTAQSPYRSDADLALLKMLDNTDTQFYALKNIPKMKPNNPKIFSILINKLNSARHSSRQLYLDALSRMDPTSSENLDSLFQTDTLSTQEIVKVFEQTDFSDPQIRLNLVQALNSQNKNVRLNAAQLLRKAPNREQLHPSIIAYVSPQSQCAHPIDEVMPGKLFPEVLEELRKSLKTEPLQQPEQPKE